MSKRVVVFGGSGFIGAVTCARLSQAGWRVTVPTRRGVHARSVQTLPGVDVVEADVFDEAALGRLLAGQDAAVNLIAILQGKAADFERVHVQWPAQLGRACAAAGVRRVVHVSALGCSLTGRSMYQRTKAGGEVAIRAFGLDVTVLRPSIVFGAGDRLLNLFARMQAHAPFVPLAGAETRFQPVWVSDVASAIAAVLRESGHVGKVYELCGADVVTLGELVRLAGRLSGNARPVFDLPASTAHAMAWVLEHLPGQALMSRDNLASLEQDNVASPDTPGLAALGITPARLLTVAPTYLGPSVDAALDHYRRSANR